MQKQVYSVLVKLLRQSLSQGVEPNIETFLGKFSLNLHVLYLLCCAVVQFKVTLGYSYYVTAYLNFSMNTLCHALLML